MRRRLIAPGLGAAAVLAALAGCAVRRDVDVAITEEHPGGLVSSRRSSD